MSPDCGCVPGSLPQPRHLRQWASRHTRLRPETCFRRFRCCSCAGSQRNVPAPLYFRDPLAPWSCAHSNQPHAVAPAAAPRRAARCCLPSRRGHRLARWCGERRSHWRPGRRPDLAAAVPIEQDHRSEKRRRVASEAIESSGMQLGRNQMLHHASWPSLMQLDSASRYALWCLAASLTMAAIAFPTSSASADWSSPSQPKSIKNSSMP